MALKIIKGRSGCGKSTYLLNDMPENESVIYIVPEQFTFTAEQMLINRFGMVGLGKPEVLSFMRLADMVFNKYGAPEFISDNASFEMLVSYCANSIKPEKLRLFDGLVKKSELAQTASSIITTFKRYRITPSQLEFAAHSTTDELLKKKINDSLAIYNSYLNETKSAGLSDINDKLSILADMLADDECDFLDDKHIYIDQFADFDPCESECIKQMIKRAKSVTVALCTNGQEPFETVNKTYNRLLNICTECNIPPEAEIELPGAMLNASPMLRHLENCYFEDETPSFAGTDGSINIYCGTDKNSEIHYVAEEITHLVRDKGFRYKDISVVARDAELYKNTVTRVFPLYDIPVFVDRKMPLSGHSIAIFITSILEIALGGFSYENIFTYIKSPFSPISMEEADILENYCITTGVKSYSWSKPFSFKSSVYKGDSSFSKDEYTAEKMSEINSIREKVYIPLNNLISNLKKTSTAAELCINLFDFFAELNIENKIRRQAQILEEKGENLHALQTMQVYNILVEIFNDIFTVLGEKKLSLREFRTVVMSGFQAVEIGTIPSSSDCVTLGSIDRIKGHGAKIVFVVGANNGVFPAFPTESGLFSDYDKQELESYGIEMPPGRIQMAQSEQLLVYDALTCGEEKLYISYATSDSSAQVLLPSEIVEKVISIFPDITYLYDLNKKSNYAHSITTKKAVFDLLCSHLRAYKNEGQPLPHEINAAAYYFSKDETYAPLLQQAIDMTQYTNSAKRIYPSLMDKALEKSSMTSITRLEAYNKCPFSYFAKYLLKLEPKNSFEISTADSGSFLHDFLDKFSQLISESVDKNGNNLTWRTIDEDFIRVNTPIVLESVLSGVNTFILDMPRIKALFDRLCKTAENSVYAIRRHIIKSDFVPLGCEISFDENGNFKPVKIVLEDGKTIKLSGRIDRADVFEIKLSDGQIGKFVRVIDYKSTDKKVSLSEVYHGVQLQLFVYLSTLCDNGYLPGGILYCNLTDKIVGVNPGDTEDIIEKKKHEARRMEGIVLSEYDMVEHMGGNEVLKTGKTASMKSFNSIFKHLHRVIKNTAQNIYGGNFPIRCTQDACAWCEYAQLCRFDRTFSGCTENIIPNLKNEEVLTLLEEEALENEMD